MIQDVFQQDDTHKPVSACNTHGIASYVELHKIEIPKLYVINYFSS